MITIGFTRASAEEKYQLYVKWLKSIDRSFEYINFYRMDIPDALEALDNCSGLVLTGGADIHPHIMVRERKRIAVSQTRTVISSN